MTTLINNNDYTDATFWNQSYKNATFRTLEKENPLYIYIKSQMQEGRNKRFLELGCYPGSYSSIFGELGYELNGIDYAQGVDNELPESFKKRGFQVGKFYKGDIFKVDLNDKYDVIGTFGLIEHFENYLQVIDIHDKYLKNGGEMFITVPNFAHGLQGLIHKYLDGKNLSVHNTKAMDPTIWKEYLEKKGYAIKNYGYLGKFQYWLDDQPRNFLQKVCLKSLPFFTPLLRMILPQNNKYFAPYCYLHCVKN
jgi:L-malate glycosyltransferase